MYLFVMNILVTYIVHYWSDYLHKSFKYMNYTMAWFHRRV